MQCSKQSRPPLIRTLPTRTLILLPPTRIQIHQVTTAYLTILVAVMGAAVVVPPKVVTNLPRAPHPGAVAESTIRGQGRVPHLGTSRIDVLPLRCPRPAEAVTRGLGLGPDLHCPHLDDDATTSPRLHHLGTAIVATENVREKGRLFLFLVPAAAVITAIEVWTLTAHTRLCPHLGMATRTGETETETEMTTCNTTSGLLRLCESGHDRRLHVPLG